YNEKLYDITDLFYRDSKKFEDSLLKAGANDVFETYYSLKEDSSFKYLYNPLSDGRYQGRSVFGVMKECNARDIYTFLHFVLNYPGKYIGHTWKLNETFATWVINKAPYSKKEIYDSVVTYKNNPTLLKSFITKNLSLIKEKEFVTEWIDDARNAISNEEEEKAIAYLDAAKLVLPYLKEDCVTGYYFYTYASLYKMKEQYSKVFISYDTAYKYFSLCENDYFKANTLLQKGLIYISMEKVDDALNEFEKMKTELNRNESKLSINQKALLMASYHHFTGFILAEKKGELNKAVQHYKNAIELYSGMKNYSSIQSTINVQGRLARLYKRQGELQKALVIYEEQLKQYTEINDRKNIANTLDNIADIEFKLANYRKAINQFSTARDIYLSYDEYNDAGFSQSNIGQAYWNLGKYDSAIMGHLLAIEYRRVAKNNAGLAYSWKKIGGLYKETGEKQKAFFAYDSSAYYYSLAKDSINLGNLLEDYGDVYYNDKQYQKAFDKYMQWHKINLASGNKSKIASSLYQLANATFYYDVPSSKKYAIECLNLSKSIGDKSNEYYANTLLGFLVFKDFNYEDGVNYFANALQIAIEQKNKSQEAFCYRMMGSAYSDKMDFTNAINYTNKAIHIYDSLGEKTSLPISYRILGGAYQSKGDFYEARKQYQKSIDIAYAINSRADVGYGYSSLTFLYTIQGELAKAEQVTDSCYNIFKDLDNNWQIAQVYFNKGLVYSAKDDGVNAIKYYLMADSIYTKENDLFSISTCNTNIGSVFYYQADYDKALKYFYAADSILNKINFITEAHILAPINIGEAYYYKKDYAKAEPYLLKGYKMAVEKNAGRMKTIGSSFLGTLYYDLKKYDLSEKYLLESFSLAQKSNETDLYINSGMYLGKLYTAKNDSKKAEEYYRKTIDFIKTIDNSKYTWMAYYEYGLNQYNLNKLDSAVVYFKKAVEIVEEGSKNLFGGAEAKKIYNADERKVDLYNKLVAALAKQNKTDEALYYANKGNVQAVKEKTENAGISTTDKEKEDAIKKGGELLQKKNAVTEAIAKEKAKPEKEQNKQLIASLESVKNVAETDYANYIDGLVKKYPDMQSYFSNTNPNDFRNYIEYIPDNTLVALYIVNDNQLFIFTVTSKETSIKTVPLNQDINKQASRLLSILRNPNNVTGTRSISLRSTLKPTDDVRGDFKKEATELYNLLITPIADDLKGKENLCIITNGRLSSIPFQSLGKVDENNNFHFLMEDYAIFYTSKIDIFAKMYKNRKMESSLAIFGNPDKSLPGATIEAEEISKIVPASTVYIEDKATESKAKESLQKYNYVHFATHGILDYTDFNESYLLFAPDVDGSSDGKLTIKEINGLSKQTNSMVVLSACETAVSKEEVKGWYISPANAFLTNRVDAVLGSLWKVPDETTNLLLQEFYKNIEQKKMSKVEALRHAQATVSQNPKYSHPFYWSAFVLYGEWR
ncbi:MAG: CHAT domain-containing protein, partial [Chitinophagales bacterium]|nr:CHAT domain-containing protein [Chitinophagales bacterium]